MTDQKTGLRDFLASWVVFLVALPLCMGIAIASGLPPASGILTGIVGGIVVGSFSGSPLQVSGPAAGLAVMVWQLVKDHGVGMLGPILLIAGILQIVAGHFSLGRWFRAMSPAVIYGMLTGIGILLFAGQIYVAFDLKPHGRGLENLAGLSFLFGLQPGPAMDAGAVALVTLLALLIWTYLRPKALAAVPAPLIAVIAGTSVAALWHLPVAHVDLPSNLLTAVRLPHGADLLRALQPRFLFAALAVAFVASAETLLSAAAVDRLHTGPRTRYDQELQAQGLGNAICGILGALPMTGVVVRSSANVQAGARTRLSAILHGVWLLAFVILLPQVLRLVPTASLAAVLVYTGLKLIDWKGARSLLVYGRMPILIYAATVIGIVAEDLLTGVMVGVGLTLLKLLYKVSQLAIYHEYNEATRTVDLYLEGAATFLNIPELAAILDGIPPGAVLSVHTAQLMYIDHACLDLFSNWERQAQSSGSRLNVEWDHLMSRFERGQGIDVEDLNLYRRAAVRSTK